MVKPASGQAIHVMFAHHAVEDIGLKHGVEFDTGQFNVVVFQHAAIVFQVLANFPCALIFQQGLELCQNGSAIQLIRRIKIVMGNRQIGGFTGRHREADADDVSAQGIQRVGLQIKRKDLAVFQLLQPAIKEILIQNGDITLGR